MPLSLPEGEITAEQFDELLAAGYRRSGWFFYRTQCAACQACEPLRIEVASFHESRSMRRVRKLGNANLRLQVDAPVLDDSRLQLFNKHRCERNLDRGEAPAAGDDYTSFLLNSFCEVWELSFWQNDQLIAVSITDVGKQSLSAVYCFFDPEFSWLSPGTFAILSQISLARQQGYKWLYLGMFVADTAHLCYKSRFGPHQRLQRGEWQLYPPATLDKQRRDNRTGGLTTEELDRE